MIYVQTAASGPVSVSDEEAREALRERRQQAALHRHEPRDEPGPKLIYGFQTDAR